MHTFENPRGEAGRVGILFEKISRGREVHYFVFNNFNCIMINLFQKFGGILCIAPLNPFPPSPTTTTSVNPWSKDCFDNLLQAILTNSWADQSPFLTSSEADWAATRHWPRFCERQLWRNFLRPLKRFMRTTNNLLQTPQEVVQVI
jgi:hypothetical protein